MKNTITKIFATLLCLALCFAFVGCSEFSGNFSTKATSEEINSTFAKIADAEIATEGITGFQMDMQMKMTGEEQGEATAKYLINLEKDEASCVMNATSQEEGSMNFGIYIKEKVLYCDINMNMGGSTITSQTKTDMSEIYDNITAEDIFDMSSDMGGMDFDFDEFFSESAEELEKMGAEVYIDDSSNSLKIKMVFNGNPTEEDMPVVTGSAIYVFDANYNITACKYDVTMTMDGSTIEMNVILKSYSGSIKLPSGAEDWKEEGGIFDFIF